VRRSVVAVDDQPFTRQLRHHARHAEAGIGHLLNRLDAQ
jgi:hypothetical protein